MDADGIRACWFLECNTIRPAMSACPPRPQKIYRQGAANLDPEVVRAIQFALATAAFDPGPIDGDFGPNTTAAVAAFQTVNGLISDGEVGPQTAGALGVEI
jgi:peptidoglycan hydrolase-like protein with peptidoglycan-binding domain